MAPIISILTTALVAATSTIAPPLMYNTSLNSLNTKSMLAIQPTTLSTVVVSAKPIEHLAQITEFPVAQVATEQAVTPVIKSAPTASITADDNSSSNVVPEEKRTTAKKWMYFKYVKGLFVGVLFCLIVYIAIEWESL
jgi:hypothetical protein